MTPRPSCLPDLLRDACPADCGGEREAQQAGLRPAGDSHDVGFVHGRDVAPVVAAGVLEGELRDASARLLGDELDALHDPVDDLGGAGRLTGMAGAGRGHRGVSNARPIRPTARMGITEVQRWPCPRRRL